MRGAVLTHVEELSDGSDVRGIGGMLSVGFQDSHATGQCRDDILPLLLQAHHDGCPHHNGNVLFTWVSPLQWSAQ